MLKKNIKLIWLMLLMISTSAFGQVVNTTPVNLVGSSDPIPGPGGFFGHPFTPSPLTGTYHGGVYYGATKEKWGYNISGLTAGTVYTLTIYYMYGTVQLTPAYDRRGDLNMNSGAPLSVTMIPPKTEPEWLTWFTVTTTFTATGPTDRIDIEADGTTDNSLWLFTDIAIDASGGCDDLTLSVTPATAEICAGDMLTLDATSINGGAITWDGGATDGVAFAPAGTGTITYTATSTHPDDCPFTTDVIINPLPVVTAAADNTSICAGDPVTLTGGGATSYVWTGGVTDGVAFNPAATATYTVTGTDGNGCENTDDVTVTVNPLPAIGAGLDQSICDGASVTLSGSGAGVGGAYVWDGGVTDGVAFTPAATTVYTVTGTDANGCIGTDDVTVSVGASPAMNAGLDVAVCDGDPVTLSGSGAGVGGTYAWDGGITDGTAFTPVATTVYTVTGTTVDGCVGTDDVTVTVNPAPAVDAGLDVSICQGEMVTLTAAGTAIAYVWDGGIADGVAFSPAATTTYTVTGTGATGCTADDAVTVTVNALPIIDAGVDASICQGEFVTLSAAGAGGGGAYVWDGGVSNGTPFSPGATATYTVVGTDANGCVGTDMVDVIVNPLPIVNFGADVTQGCAPLTVNFTSLDPGATYDWTFGDGSSGTGAATSHMYTGVGSFDVSLTITSPAGCVNSASITDYITVVAQPIASFTFVTDDNSVLNNSVAFNDNSINATSLEWSFGDGTSNEFGENLVHEFPEGVPGSYDVWLTASNDFGCVDSVLQIITIKDKLLYFVPNAFTPDGDDVNNVFRPVFSSGLNIYDYHLTIFNRWGEIVFESYDVTGGWNGAYGNGGLVEDGTYVWTIEFGETMSDKKHTERGTVTVLK